MKNFESMIMVRGGGDLATGIIHRLANAGFKVLVLECEKPMAIRRQVAFGEAVFDGKTEVEGITARLIDFADVSEDLSSRIRKVWDDKEIPVVVDPDAKLVEVLKPEVLIDAIIAKKNLGTKMDMAPLTIGVGPGFEAGIDTHFVVETKRGHNLGRVIRKGMAAANSGKPGNIGGYTAERVIHAPAAGVIKNISTIGDVVEKGQVIAEIGYEMIPVYASLTGILRGLIRDGYEVEEGLKIADIDPRKEELKNCFTISDKARCIAGGVLEIVCGHYLDII